MDFKDHMITHSKRIIRRNGNILQKRRAPNGFKTERFEVLQFLAEYQKLPCLWKKSCKDFKSRTKREYAEKQLLPISGFSTIKELRRKIRNIRCTYNQEVAKIKKSMETTTNDGEIYKPKLAWFSFANTFLRENFERKNIKSKSVLTKVSTESSQDEYDAIATSCDLTQEPPLSDDSHSVVSDIPSLATTRTQKPQKLSSVIDKIVPQPRFSLNEFVSFGQHVASQLQCLSIEEAVLLQQDIQKLITAARLRCIRKTDVNASNFANSTIEDIDDILISPQSSDTHTTFTQESSIQYN